VPAGLTPVTRDDLLRRWVARGENPDAYVRFDADGTFHGSDGCNATGGRYLVGTGGELVSVTGGQTLIGCDNSDMEAWVLEAARAALDGSALVLLDAHAHELGRLHPAAP
jgi:heat shock protein HslJ